MNKPIKFFKGMLYAFLFLAGFVLFLTASTAFCTFYPMAFFVVVVILILVAGGFINMDR